MEANLILRLDGFATVDRQFISVNLSPIAGNQ